MAVSLVGISYSPSCRTLLSHSVRWTDLPDHFQAAAAQDWFSLDCAHYCILDTVFRDFIACHCQEQDESWQDSPTHRSPSCPRLAFCPVYSCLLRRTDSDLYATILYWGLQSDVRSYKSRDGLLFGSNNASWKSSRPSWVILGWYEFHLSIV